MKRVAEIFLWTGLMLLAGCASVSIESPTAEGPAAATGATPPQEPLPAGAPPQDVSAQTSPVQGGDATQATDIPGAAPPPPPPPLPPVSGNPAVVALLDRAQGDIDAGRADAAGATLERALRIEPRNARLWHALAQLRLTRGLYAQAVALAQKSNSFAGTDRRLRAMNWHVIAEARIAQGNAEAGQKALALAAELEQ